MKGMKKILYILCFVSAWGTACNNDNGDDVDQRAVDETRIQEYITSNNLDAMAVGEGLYVVIDSAGTGATPGASDFLAVHYEGFLLDGTQFDSSRDRKAVSVFPLNGVIQGWQLGIPQFKVGGGGTLLIPSHLAYGSNPPPGIPSNAILRFEVAIYATGATRDPVQRIADDQSIQDYLAENNLTAEEVGDGLYYVEETLGSGPNPTAEDTVTVHYEGFLLNGNKFDSSLDRNEPTTFPLSGVIQGWQRGIPLLQEGGTGKLLIPSHLAYGGSTPSALIPPYSVLVFDVELLQVGG